MSDSSINVAVQVESSRREPSSVRTEVSGSGRWIIVDRPEKANALDAATVEALIEAVAEAVAAQATVIAFRGNGRNFSAGFDFTDFEAQTEGDLLRRFVRIECLLQAILTAPSVTVAFAQGRNFGAGVDLFACCRYRVAAPSATFLMPGLGFGLVLGTRRFGQIVGAAAATSVLAGQRTFNATEGVSMGFVRELDAEANWPARIEAIIEDTQRLSTAGRVMLLRALVPPDLDRDMADLVRSVAQPGLKERIRKFRSSPTPASTTPDALRGA